MLILKEPELIDDKTCIQGYAIDSDPMNIILYKSMINLTGKKKGEINHIAVSYHTSIGSVLEKVYALDVGLLGLGDLQALDTHVRATIATCVESLGKLNKVRGDLHGQEEVKS